MKKRRLRNDIILILLLIAIPAAIIVYNGIKNKDSIPAVASITVDGEIVARVTLSEDTEFRVETAIGYNDIVIRDGSVYVAGADCPDLTCVKHTEISRTGEQIVCLPHRLVVEILQGREEEVDSVSQ